MFNVNDYIVYGSNGVCQVADLCTPKICGVDKDKKYYVLQPLYSKNTTIYTPVDNTKVIMRNIISKEETEKLIKNMPSIGTISVDDDENKDRKYKDALYSLNHIEWVKLIKTIYNDKKQKTILGKKICDTDKYFLQATEDFLYSELSIPLNIPKEQVEEYIIKKIDQLQNNN